jgi:F0F1-type ATP synthase membrane subunit b/b'
MDLDRTILIQLGLLLFVLVTVGNLLFKPFLRIIELREKSISGAKAEGAALVAQAAEKDAELHRALDDTRRKAMAERNRLLADAQKAERQILDGARADAQRKVESARAALAASQKDISAKLKSSTQELARGIAAKVLQRDIA